MTNYDLFQRLLIEMATSFPPEEVVERAKRIVSLLKKEEPVGLPIERLGGLSVRLRHILRTAGISTVDELVKMSESEVRAFRGLGHASFFDLEDALRKAGIEWTGRTGL